MKSLGFWPRIAPSVRATLSPTLRSCSTWLESLADDVPDWNREQARADALNNPLPPQASENKRQTEMTSYDNNMSGILKPK